MLAAATRLVDAVKIVKALSPQVPSTSTSLWVDLANATHVSILISVVNTSGSITGSAITFNQATAIAGTGSKALTTYFSNLTCATNDMFTQQTATGGTFTTLTTASASAQYLVELNATDLDINNSFTCLQVALATGANCTIDVEIFVSGLRFGGNFAQNPSVLV
jgi:hypothetical protein